MCERCDELDAKIRRYIRLAGHYADKRFMIVAEALERLATSEKDALHPKH
jgi:hypothetical protein